MLQNIDREDLETLWKLVKAKHGNTRPEEGYERVLWGDLKVMFESDIESEVWRSLEGHNVTVMKRISSSACPNVGNPEGNDYPFDLTKPLPLVMNGNRQMVSVEYFFNNDLKYLQGGISTMTYTTSITKTKAAQYDLPGIEDMVRNIWSPVKVAYDKHALWGISHWRDQRKTFYGYARGLESTHDVYSTKRILAVTQVEVMRKHGYGYLREIEVRRADNNLYTFKERDFPRLRTNDIEDMLILIIQNRITNLSSDDVSDFAIALLMRSDELYKFSDGTLTRLRTSLDDITKNIRMKYLPQRRWSSLEKKKANIMIKAIVKQLKEKRTMRSFEKFVGGRHYGTNLRLLQQTS
ncbi:hypothetical protein Tco_0507543 [Tanacetum coccineum]